MRTEIYSFSFSRFMTAQLFTSFLNKAFLEGMVYCPFPVKDLLMSFPLLMPFLIDVVLEEVAVCHMSLIWFPLHYSNLPNFWLAPVNILQGSCFPGCQPGGSLWSSDPLFLILCFLMETKLEILSFIQRINIISRGHLQLSTVFLLL